MKKISYITLIVFIICIVRIAFYIYDSFNTKKIEDISNTYIIPSKEYSIDFKRLKSINPDVVGYIEIEDLDIGYVFVKGKNNTYYLNHNLQGEYSGSGWIFMDYRNSINDKNIVLYGHNMKDGSMFGHLRKMLYERGSGVIKIYFEDGMHEYRVFSTYISEYEEYYLTTWFKSDIEFTYYLDVITGRSNYNYRSSLDSNDYILTLSTCYGNTEKRVVVHAYRVY